MWRKGLESPPPNGYHIPFFPEGLERGWRFMVVISLPRQKKETFAGISNRDTKLKKSKKKLLHFLTKKLKKFQVEIATIELN